MAEAMLRAEGVSFAYGSYQVLDGISFEIGGGRLCGLFGPNGSGKTTLFRCCLGLLKAKGHIAIDGTEIGKLNSGRLAKLVAYVPQEHQPPFPYSVFDVVLMGRTPHMGAGMFRVSQEDKDKSYAALERLGVADLAESSYNNLSGGQRQLVLIARAIAQDTPLILLDEPTSALDFSNQVRVWELLREITASGTTVFACAHDPNHVSWFCDHVVMMHDRRVLASGPTDEVFTVDNLNTLYDGACAIVQTDRARIVVPRALAAEEWP